MKIDFEKIEELLSKGISLKTKKGQIKRKDLAYIPRKNDKKTNKALKEIETYHNHSWYEEIYQRNKKHLDSVALFYRGNEITYREMFDKMKQLAKSLKVYGIKKGDEIPVCLSNTPELLYLMGAISMIGAKINVFGPNFDKDYVTKILNETESSIIFIEDNYYEKLKDSIKSSNINNTVLISLANSLKNGVYPLENEKNVQKFVNKVENLKKNDSSLIDFNDFIKLGLSYKESIQTDIGLDDEFSITYTSGSTNAKHPKQIVHTNRSFITIARYHDPDMVGGIDMSRFVVQAHLPTYSNTDLISCISDSLMQGSKLALEPISDENNFLDSLLLNKPNYVVASTSFWICAMKKILYDSKYKDTTLPDLLFAFGAGEGMSVNEEKFLNKGLKKAKAGSKFIPSFIASTIMSAAGGDCEHGGIFYTLFRFLGEKKIGLNYHQEAGLKLMDFAELAVLDKNGSYCSKGEYGRIVANSGCSMEYYKNDPEATNKFFIKDAYGKTWGDCCIYGFIDRKDKVHIKGRIPKNGEKLPTFLINDVVLQDQVNILSALTVCVTENENDYYVVHFEKMPDSLKSDEEIMKNILFRINHFFGSDISSRIFFRVHSFDESFKTNGSGKRDFNVCQLEGISDKAIFVNLDNDIKQHIKK